MHLHGTNNLVALGTFLASSSLVGQVGSVLADRYVNVRRKVLVDFLNDLLQVIIALLFFNRLQHLGDEEQVRDELGR